MKNGIAPSTVRMQQHRRTSSGQSTVPAAFALSAGDRGFAGHRRQEMTSGDSPTPPQGEMDA